MFRSTSTFCLAYVFLVFPIVEISPRKLTIKYNEGCDIPECRSSQEDTNNTFNLAHITAVGDSDTVHYLWSSIGGPTILLAVTDRKADLQINWTRFLRDEDVSNSITFTEKPTYTMALVIPKLIEFNDTNDTADVSSPSNNVTDITRLDAIDWHNFNDTIDYNTCSGTFQSEMSNSSLLIKMRAYNQTGRADSLPHLQYTENTTQFDFSLSMFPSHFENSRYAVELLMVSEEAAIKDVKKSIDDEYTPAIFSIINLIVPASSGSPYGSYSQWKPVTYSHPTRSLSDSLQCHETKVTPYNETLPSRSLLRAFFDMSQVTLSSINVTFGTSEDLFYKNTNYTSWSATIGYGDPPVESLSQLVIILISTGLGFPVLICIGGGMYTCAKKWKINKLAAMNSSRYPPVTSVN